MTNKTKNAFTLVAIILTIVALALPAFLAITNFLLSPMSIFGDLFGDSFLLFNYVVNFHSIHGNLLLVLAGAFIGTVLIVDKKIAHGICLIIFNVISLGIWGLVMAIKTRTKFKPKKAESPKSDFQQTSSSNAYQQSKAFVEKQTPSTLSYEYYAILNLTKSASNEEIKKAYRAQAKLFHPDINSSSDAHDKFVEINKAFNVLSDVHQRAAYDRLGHQAYSQKY